MFKLLFKYTKEYKFYALITPIFVIAEVIFDVVIPYVMSLIIDVGIKGPNGSDLNYIYKMGAVMVALSIGAMVTGALSGIFGSIASSGFIKNLRKACYDKIQQYSFANIENFEVPSLVTRLTKDMREIRMAYIAIIRQLFRAPLNCLFSAIMVYRINKDLSAIFWLAVPLLAFGMYIISKTAHPMFRKLMYKFDAMNASLEENFIAIRVVKTFVRENYEKIKYNRTSEDVRNQQRKAEFIVNFNNPYFNFVMYACMIAICWYGGNMIITGDLSQGSFMSYLSYMKAILFSLLMVSSSLMQVVFAQAAVDRINEVLDEKIDITDEGNDESILMEDGSIEFKNVNFAYSKKAEKMALSDINLKIASGETIGIIGSTGSGKTSLVQLIDRLYDVSDGEMIVGGHNVKDYKLSNLRKNIAMVLQKNTLFSGSIEENLKWGNMDATHQEVVEACKVACADDFVSSFPEGYNTDLGQGGVNVSGGQKQRLCIARALLKKPKIIILDDSTSAVDTDTDHRIRTALKEQLAGMTTIIIAQRINSVMDADRIVVMEDGKILDVGTHQQLLERNSIYSDLYITQAQGVAE